MPEVDGFLVERRHVALHAQALLEFAKSRKLAGHPLPSAAMAEVEAVARAALGTTSASGSEVMTHAEVAAVSTGQWVTVEQVAGLMHCTTSWVRQQLRTGDLAGRKVGSVWLIDRNDIKEGGAA